MSVGVRAGVHVPLKPCLRCGRLSPGSYCADHDPARQAWKVRPSPSSRDRLPPSVRKRVRERDGNRCGRCGCPSGESRLVVDHVLPASRGGPHDERNLVTLCQRCHRAKTAAERRRRKMN